MYGRIGAELGGNPYGDAPSRTERRGVRGDGRSWKNTPSLVRPALRPRLGGAARACRRRLDRAAWLYGPRPPCRARDRALLAASIARRRAFAAAFVGLEPAARTALRRRGPQRRADDAALSSARLHAPSAGRRPGAGSSGPLAIGVKWVAAGLPGASVALDRVAAARAARPSRPRGGHARSCWPRRSGTATTWLEAFARARRARPGARGRSASRVGSATSVWGIGRDPRCDRRRVTRRVRLARRSTAWRRRARLGVTASGRRHSARAGSTRGTSSWGGLALGGRGGPPGVGARGWR